MSLTETKIRKLEPKPRNYSVSDGEGLNLVVSAKGAKTWSFAYLIGGRHRRLSLGAWPEIGLEEARALKVAARRQVRDGIDPAVARKVEKAKRASESDTFRSVATRWFEVKRARWKSSYADRIWARIEGDILPAVGSLPMSAITPPLMLDAIRKIERRGAPVLARRIKQSCGQIFRFAIAEGRALIDPTAALNEALAPRGPIKRRAALPAHELPTFFAKLESLERDAATVYALRIIVPTFVRTMELRFAEWSEFDLNSKEPLWRIPGARMKRGLEHLVPLAPSVVRTLRELKALELHKRWLFPGPGKSGVISENAMIYGLYAMGYHSKATVHGFRGTASTVLNESGLFESDWIEMQLAHVEENDVRAAYNSAQYLPQRRRMMRWYADFLEKKKEVGQIIG